MGSPAGVVPAGASSALDAERLGAGLPELLVAAERVAATVAQGVHGRRRVGAGDSFWQYRPVLPGEPISRIDWRQSAKSDRAFVRETEWEAAQTVCLWRDASASMGWRSDRGLPEKRTRAALLLLALASLLLRGGEHVRLLGSPVGGQAGTLRTRASLERLAGWLDLPSTEADPFASVPRHARLVMLGDFLDPPAVIEHRLERLSALQVAATLVQVLDPAELALPYEGRVRFRGLEGEGDLLVARSQDLHAAYAEAMQAHQARLRDACTRLGHGFLVHDTGTQPQTALLALHDLLAARG